MLTPEQYAQEFQCSFDAAILGSYFGRELTDAETAGRITSVPYDPAIPVHTAWDIGIGDSTAIWFFQIVLSELHVIDHYEASGFARLAITSMFSNRSRINTVADYLPHDAMARELGSRLRRHLRDNESASSGRRIHGSCGSCPSWTGSTCDPRDARPGVVLMPPTVTMDWRRCARITRSSMNAPRFLVTDRNMIGPVIRRTPHGTCLWHGVRSPPEKPKPRPRDSWDAAFNRDEAEELARLEGGVRRVCCNVRLMA